MILPLEQQVVSLESANRLKELGCEQFGTIFAWAEVNQGGKEWRYEIVPNDFQADVEFIAAYTVAELGELIGNHLSFTTLKTVPLVKNQPIKYRLYINEKKLSGIPIDQFDADTEADARALLLIHLISNGLSEKK